MTHQNHKLIMLSYNCIKQMHLASLTVPTNRNVENRFLKNFSMLMQWMIGCFAIEISYRLSHIVYVS